jgi:hypothetical protein
MSLSEEKRLAFHFIWLIITFFSGEFKAFASAGNVYDRLVLSFAPSIWELDDVKKGTICSASPSSPSLPFPLLFQCVSLYIKVFFVSYLEEQTTMEG